MVKKPAALDLFAALEQMRDQDLRLVHRYTSMILDVIKCPSPLGPNPVDGHGHAPSPAHRMSNVRDAILLGHFAYDLGFPYLLKRNNRLYLASLGRQIITSKVELHMDKKQFMTYGTRAEAFRYLDKW